MPTYTPLGTSIKLVTCSLADTTTARPERAKCEFTSREIKKARDNIKSATPLAETHVPIFGETSRLHFLGDVPFYLVQCGRGYFESRELNAAERVEGLVARRQFAVRYDSGDCDGDGETEDELYGSEDDQVAYDGAQIGYEGQVDHERNQDVHEEGQVDHEHNQDIFEEGQVDHEHNQDPLERNQDAHKEDHDAHEGSQDLNEVHHQDTSKDVIGSKADRNTGDDVKGNENQQDTSDDFDSNKEQQDTSENADGGEEKQEADKTIPAPSRTPQALALIVTLTKKTYLQLFDGKLNGKHKEKPTRQSVKIDVFFNGELASSDTIAARHSVEKRVRTIEEVDIRITAGKRVAVLAERPWVFLPPRQNPDRSLIVPERPEALAESRWKEISDAIMAQADEQGFKDDKRPPLGQYLVNLASMEMPEALEGMQKPDGHKFGVIDVVISVGTGTKEMYKYLVEPQRVVDRSFKRKMPDPQARSDKQTLSGPTNRPSVSSTDNLQAAHRVSSCPLERKSEVPPEGATAAATRERRNIIAPVSYRDANPWHSRRTTPILGDLPSSSAIELSASLTGLELESQNSTPFPSAKGEGNTPSHSLTTGTTFSSNTPKCLSPATLAMPPPRTPSLSSRRRKRRYSDTLTPSESSPMTLRPSSIRPGASVGSKSVSAFMGITRRGVFDRSRPQEKVDTNDGLSVVNSAVALPKDRIFAVNLKLGARTVVERPLSLLYDLRKKTKVYNTAQDPLSSFQPLDESVIFSFTDLKHNEAIQRGFQASGTDPQLRLNTQLPVSSKMQGEFNVIMSNTKAKGERQKCRLLEDSKALWKASEMSKDCVIGFAEEGPWIESAGKGGVLRQTSSTRVGEFKENEIVFAVRYLITE